MARLNSGAPQALAGLSPGQLSLIHDLVALAIHEQNSRRFDKAEEAYREIVAIAPDWAEAESNLANVLNEQGKLQQAVEWYLKALALKPQRAEIHYNLGNVLKDLNNLEEATARYQTALRLRPDYAEAHNNLGIALQLQNRIEEAIEHFERAIALKPDNAEAHNNLGTALQEQGELKEAGNHYREALAIEPQNAVAHNNLGTVLKELGEFSEARAEHERALALQPDYPEAHYNRAEVATFRHGDPEILALEALANRMDHLPQSKQVYIHFTLAKALDEVGEHARAFEHMITGNALKRQEIDYDEAGTRETFRLIADVFEPGLFERFQGAGDRSSVPIFVLGMPRSGSTLIEQILASHPSVLGAGELNTLTVVCNSRTSSYPECMSHLSADGLRRLSEEYLATLPELPPGKSRITDKTPLNFLLVGLIRLILPNARIIHTVRDPVDTCISCFSKLFRSDMKFSYSLAELGRYYRNYRELMAHWRSVLPIGSMLEVCYEDVVNNIEDQARRLLDYCGLPWDERCLSFYQTSRPVATASAVQIRQPLFRSSVHRWHRYKNYLQPLLSELECSQLTHRCSDAVSTPA